MIGQLSMTTQGTPQFKPHSIKPPKGVLIEHIGAMCEFNEKLYIGYSGVIMPCRYNPDSSAEPYLEPKLWIELYKSDDIEKRIVGMHAVRSPALMFVHYFINKAPGPLVVFSKRDIEALGQQGPSIEGDDGDIFKKACDPSESKNYEIAPICNLFAMSNELDEPFIVLTNEKKFYLYKIVKGGANAADCFQEVLIKVNVGTEIQAIGVNKHAVCFYAGGKYRACWFEKGKNFTEISSAYVPKPFVLPVSDDNFIVGNDKTMIVTGKIGEKSSPSIGYNKGFTKQVKCERPPVYYWHKDNVFMFFPETCLMGQVTHKNPVTFRDIPVPNVRLVTRRLDLGDLIMLNDKEFFTVGGLGNGTRYATMALESGSVDVAAIQILRIKNEQDQQDVLVEMFRDLWVRDGKAQTSREKKYSPPTTKVQEDASESATSKSKTKRSESKVDKEPPKTEKQDEDKYAKAKVYAIQLLSKVLWRGDIREILSLFPFIMLANPLAERAVLKGTQPVEHPDEDLIDEFGRFLWHTSNEYKMSTDTKLTVQVPIIDTAIFQFFAVRHETRKLDRFLQEQNSVDMQLVERFFEMNYETKKLNLYPAHAVWHTNRNKIPEALRIWRALDRAANPEEARDVSTSGRGERERREKWAKEASYTLHRTADWTIIRDALTWISQRGLPLAVNAFCHPLIDVREAVNWIKENTKPSSREQMECLIQLYDYVIDNTPVTNEVIESSLLQFCRYLDLLDGKEKNERSNRIARVIRKYGLSKSADVKIGIQIPDFIKKIKQDDYNNCVTDLMVDMPQWLKMEFYSIGELYEDAMEDSSLNLLNEQARSRLQEFCRNAPTPSEAFMVALRKISKNPGPNIITKDFLARERDFVIENLEWFDLPTLFDSFDDSLSLEDDKVDEIIQRATAVMIQKERMMTMKLKVARSMKLDVDYRLINAHLRSAEIQHHTVCAGCNRPVGSGWITIAPDNRIYHMTCKPRLPPR